ncbi:MAG TPA: trypsin-like peptidase domain-containing protein [Candidatus Binatia bacterium]|nr:trypsin-like peptidase domain-containing protein [Candidatus Binatia bacterium]
MPCLIVGLLLTLFNTTALRAESRHDNASLVNWREAQPLTTETELDRLNRAFVQLASQARPAIVQIRVTGPENSQNQGSRGSGFFIDTEGYILTAQHVIDKAREIEVRTADGQRLAARLVVADSRLDLALLKVLTERHATVLPLGDSERIRVGDLAVVFSYPFGRESSMSLGIISRAGKTYPDSAAYDFIQTDAGAYPGVSGGPLLNSQGHVVGMITMASERGNLGFATPINLVKKILPRLVRGEKFAWGWLGVQMSDISLTQARSMGIYPAKGVVVSSVLPGQPAARVGVQKQDVILAVNDSPVDSPRDVARMVGGLEAGRMVELSIMRKGKSIRLTVPLGVKPESTKAREG